jgi:hypothetical protein
MQSSGSFGTEVSTRRADTSGKVGCSLHGRTVRRATFVNSQRQAPSTLTRQAIDRPMIASPAYRRLRVGARATTPILTIVNARRRYGLISENCRETPIVTVWRIVMTHSRSLVAPLSFAVLALNFAIKPAATQEIGLVAVDNRDLARGYRASALTTKSVVNEKGERIGRIDDFIFGRDEGVFAVLAVGDFDGLNGHLVAIPFRNLKLDDPSGSIVLPGASRAALQKLPVFLYGR